MATRLAARNGAALDVQRQQFPQASAVTADVTDPGSLDRALDGASAVINCAGPFMDTSRPVVEAALRAGAHYLDVTAEQVTAFETFDNFDKPARDAGLIVMPAMAFYGGLADLMASALVGESHDADDIQVAVALDSWHPTQGTRHTGARNTAERMVIREGRLAPVASAVPGRTWDFPPPFGLQDVVFVTLSEMVTMSRHIRTRSATSYMNLAPLNDIRDTATPAPVAVDSRGRSSQRFIMDVRVSDAKGARQATSTGQDIYAVTAPLVVEACIRILGLPAGSESGARAAGEIFDPRNFLSSLDPDDITVVFQTPDDCASPLQSCPSATS
jgi:hypothetical protein